eukprot:2821270-Lingulodinium_polyedra.AAC.1
MHNHHVFGGLVKLHCTSKQQAPMQVLIAVAPRDLASVICGHVLDAIAPSGHMAIPFVCLQTAWSPVGQQC